MSRLNSLMVSWLIRSIWTNGTFGHTSLFCVHRVMTYVPLSALNTLHWFLLRVAHPIHLVMIWLATLNILQWFPVVPSLGEGESYVTLDTIPCFTLMRYWWLISPPLDSLMVSWLNSLSWMITSIWIQFIVFFLILGIMSYVTLNILLSHFFVPSLLLQCNGFTYVVQTH